MVKNTLVTGARGFVGARVMEQFPDALPFPSELLREGDAEKIIDYVAAVKPKRIVHTAAISDIGACERDPEASYQVNVLRTQMLACAARAANAKLICFSTDQVYTGCTGVGPYREEEELPEPANVYARHKLEAERRTLRILPDAVMLRATWMYDMPMYGHRNRGNLWVNALNAARTGQKLPCARAQHRGVTYVRQVVALLEQAAGLPGGVYNYGSENELTMPQTAEALYAALGLGDRARELVEVCDVTRHNLWMDCGKLRRHGILLDTTAEGFARCARDYGMETRGAGG